MNAGQLIEKLKALPPDAAVECIWDGEPRSEIQHVWLSRHGVVMLADVGEVVYSADSLPAGVEHPDASRYQWWHTPRTAS